MTISNHATTTHTEIRINRQHGSQILKNNAIKGVNTLSAMMECFPISYNTITLLSLLTFSSGSNTNLTRVSTLTVKSITLKKKVLSRIYGFDFKFMREYLLFVKKLFSQSSPVGMNN